MDAGFVQSSNIHSQIENDDCFILSVENSSEDGALEVSYSLGFLKFSEAVDIIEVFDLQGKKITVAEDTDHLFKNFSSGYYLIRWAKGSRRGIQKCILLD